MSAKATWVGITGITAADEPSAGLAAAQSLKRGPGAAGLRVLALADSAFSDGIQAVPAADEVVVVPSPQREPEAFVAAVRELARGRRFVLLPGSPGDMVALAPRRDALSQAGVRHVLPSPRQVSSLPFLGVARVAGLRIPRGTGLDPASVGRLALRPQSWPLVLRTTDGRLASAATPAEIPALAQALARPWGMVTRAHEPVLGSEISVAVLCGGHGRPLGMAAAIPLQRGGNGALWSAVTTADPGVLAATRRILDVARWTGPGELHLIRDEAGALWFTGVTPGFPSWISLAAAAGRPLVRQYVGLCLGAASLLPGAYRDGLFMSRVAMDIAMPITTLGQLATEGAFSHDPSHAGTLRAAPDHAARARVAH